MTSPTPRTSHAGLARALGAIGVAIAIGLGGGAGAGPGAGTPHTALTIWGGAAAASEDGGLTYGGAKPLLGAYVTERRSIEIAAGSAPSEVRIAGVPPTVDAATVHLRDVGDPRGLAIVAQRFQPGARTPTELLARGIGGAVTVATIKGDVTGTLRAIDDTSIVVETATGLAVLQRAGYVQDIRLANAPKRGDQASLTWRVTAQRPGAHDVEITYRADGVSWSADYLAILDEAGASLDFSAWASIKNATSATFDAADITLASRTTTGAATATSTVASYPLPGPVTLGPGDLVQVALAPPRLGVKPRTVIDFEAIADQSSSYQDFPNTDCSQANGGDSAPPAPGATVAVELDLPVGTTLPPGRARVFQRKGTLVDLVSDEALTLTNGVARLRLAANREIEGERKALTCDFDEQAHTLREKIEVTIHNKVAHPVDVIAREFLWRAPMFKVEEPSWKKPAQGQAVEKRLHLVPNGKAAWTYTVVYTWN